MIFTNHRKLQTKLYLAYLGIILLFLVSFSVFFYVFVAKKLIIQGLDNLYNSNVSLYNSIEESVNDMDTVSININYSSIVRDRLSYNFILEQNENSYKDLADLFVMINGTDSRVNYIYLYDLNGNCLQVDSFQKMTHIDITSQPWYYSVLEKTGAPYISPPYKKKVAAYTTDVVSLYRTYVNSSKQTVGIVETVKNCKSLFAPINRFQKTTVTPTRIYIYNEQGDLIYPYASNAEDPHYPDIIDVQQGNGSKLNEAKTETHTNPLTGKTEYLTSLQSTYTGWTYYAVQDKSVMLAPLHELTKTLLFFMALLTLLTLVISHYLSKQLVRPLKHLKHIIQRMQLSNLGSEATDSYPLFSVELEELYDSFASMNQKLKSSRDELIQAQEAEIAARSLALQSQMSPHFYYNSLSSIMILAENGDTASVAGMCKNLSQIMRYVTNFNTRIVNIREELDYIKEYLYCMKMRNQSSLHYEISVDPDLLDIRLPKLCLHPLVENALKYGTNCNPPWSLCIRSETTENYWKIYVEDSGPGFTPKALEALDSKIKEFKSIQSEMTKLHINGLGMANTYLRLSLYFKDNFIFEYGNTSKGHAFAAIGTFYEKEG